MTDLRGLFQNNRRREVNAVTTVVPAIIEEADVRGGTAAVVAASGDYTLLSIPAGSVVTAIYLVVDDAYDVTATLAATIGGVSVLAATSVAAVGITTGTATPMLITSATEDVVATMDVTGTPTKGAAKLVIEYVDYDRATMSYIGEQ